MEIVFLLLDVGADPNVLDDLGHTALIAAIHNRITAVVEIIAKCSKTDFTVQVCIQIM